MIRPLLIPCFLISSNIVKTQIFGEQVRTAYGFDKWEKVPGELPQYFIKGGAFYTDCK